MSSLLCVACYSTDTNGRLEYTKRTMRDLLRTVDFNKHRLGVYLNAPSDDTIEFFNDFHDEFTTLFPASQLIIKANEENVGTALAINALMAEKTDDEYVIKMDDDCIVNKVGWVEEMEEALQRDPQIGIIALKRNDLAESPFYPFDHPYHSELRMLAHEAGQTWIVAEIVNHCMGTCQMLSKELMNKIGGFTQMEGIYGYDDSLLAVRAYRAGFLSAFLCGISIDHIDEGSKTPENAQFTKWKQDYAREMQPEFERVKKGIIDGSIDFFVPFK